MGTIKIPEFLVNKKDKHEIKEKEVNKELSKRSIEALDKIGLSIVSVNKGEVILNHTVKEIPLCQLSTADCRAVADALYEVGDIIKFI